MLSKFYSILISLFIIPFLIGGIIGGLNLSLRIQEADFFGSLFAAPWALLLITVGMVAIGIYIGGILGYAFFLFLAVTFFSREQIEGFSAKLPQPELSKPNLFRVPFQAVGNFFMARSR
jgi:hypothetical protein